MIELKEEELKRVEGGTITFNASLFAAIVKGATVSFEIGRCLGSSLRKMVNKKYCAI